MAPLPVPADVCAHGQLRDVTSYYHDLVGEDITMVKLQAAMLSAALAAALAVTSVQPSSAGPFSPSKPAIVQSDVVEVRDGRRWRHRHFRPGFRRGNDLWLQGGVAIAGAIIGGAIVSQGWYGDGYYDGPYYGDGYYRREYARERVYVAPRSSYRRGFNDGYRAGYRDGALGSGSCSLRLRDSGQC